MVVWFHLFLVASVQSCASCVIAVVRDHTWLAGDGLCWPWVTSRCWNKGRGLQRSLRRHREFQLAPTSYNRLITGHSSPHQPTQWCLWDNMLKKSQHTAWHWGMRNTMWGTTLWAETRGERRRGAEILLQSTKRLWWSRYRYCSPRLHARAEGYFLKDCVPWEIPRDRAGEKDEEKGTVERKKYSLTTAPRSHLPCSGWGKRGGGIRTVFESWQRDRWCKYILGFLLFPTTKSILISNKLK